MAETIAHSGTEAHDQAVHHPELSFFLFIVVSFFYLLSQVVRHTKLSESLCPARPILSLFHYDSPTNRRRHIST
ncbi:MAG: hypothetical protein WB696_30635, partial [Chthoniobacterales bacterium]